MSKSNLQNKEDYKIVSFHLGVSLRKVCVLLLEKVFNDKNGKKVDKNFFVNLSTGMEIHGFQHRTF